MNKLREKLQLDKELYTIGEVSELLGVHIDTLRRWDKAGKLKSVRISNDSWRRYKRADILNILNYDEPNNHNK